MASSARLRRTFQYPHDSDSDSPEAMDEQEQDNLIQSLASQNASQNETLARTLIALPLLSLIAYIRPLLNPATTSFAIFCTTSLLATAFLLYRLPPAQTGIPVIDAWASGSSSSGSVGGRRSAGASSAASSLVGGLRSSRNSLGGLLGRGVMDTRSPLEKTLPYLNLGLVTLLILMGLVRGNERGGGFGWVSMGNIPGLVYSVVLTAKIVMAGVDPERDLGSLRYGYKGA
ncbi:hypothetical protein HDV63DRAFT_404517 [Trichoderma sp. SZMC 28014]